jgi:cytochrome d ubiquinol oxidase subunit I
MQTPAGYALVDGRFEPRDWMAVIFNPSFPYRLAHTVTGFYITTGFVVLGVGAWMLRKGTGSDAAKRMVSLTLWLLMGLVPLQIFLGDAHGLNTLAHQPTKLAAIEANWHRERRAPLTLVAIPDQQAEKNHFAVEVPLLGSLILTHDANGEVPGLTDVPPQDRPPVAIPFFAFRIMVGLGVIMLAIVAVGTLLRRGGRLYTNPLFLRACQWAAPIGFVAVLAGWTTTEVGRQPWTVYGLLRTADSVSPSLTGLDVAISLAGYMAAYLIMFPAGLALMARIAKRGIAAAEEEDPVEAGRPKSPIAALPVDGPGGNAR